MLARIYVTRSVPGPGVEMLRGSPHEVAVNGEDRGLDRDELLAAVAGCGGIMTLLADRVDAELMDAAGEQLRVVSNYAVGFNNIDVGAATERGIVVCTTPGVLTDATADIAWTLLLGVARRAAEGDRVMRSGGWDGWKPAELLGGDVRGRTLAIIGGGRIGYATAKRSIGWDMRVVYVSRAPKPEWERDLGAERMDLGAALRAADFVSLHVPLTPETRHMINAERLAMMKPSAYLINTSRGPVVDEAALVEALRGGRLAGAGLDVYEHEPRMAPGLAECENALLLPHLGSATIETRGAMSALAADQLLSVLDGRAPEHPVNPEAVRRLGLSSGA